MASLGHSIPCYQVRLTTEDLRLDSYLHLGRDREELANDKIKVTESRVCVRVWMRS